MADNPDCVVPERSGQHTEKLPAFDPPNHACWWDRIWPVSNTQHAIGANAGAIDLGDQRDNYWHRADYATSSRFADDKYLSGNLVVPDDSSRATDKIETLAAQPSAISFPDLGDDILATWLRDLGLEIGG